MNSLILRTTARFLLPILLLFAVFLFLRGHDEPGGGFVAGLVAATGIVLVAIASGPAEARKVLRVEPRNLTGLGLLIALLSGLPALVAGHPFQKGLWGDIAPGGVLELGIGTPVIFDLGVALLVFGMSLMIVLALLEE